MYLVLLAYLLSYQTGNYVYCKLPVGTVSLFTKLLDCTLLVYQQPSNKVIVYFTNLLVVIYFTIDRVVVFLLYYTYSLVFLTSSGLVSTLLLHQQRSRPSTSRQQPIRPYQYLLELSTRSRVYLTRHQQPSIRPYQWPSRPYQWSRIPYQWPCRPYQWPSKLVDHTSGLVQQTLIVV